MGFDYIGVGTPTFGGPAAAPTQFLDKAGRVIYVWDGLSGRWIPEAGTNASVDGVTAAGTTQATATFIPGTPTAINVTTTPASSGILLPLSWQGAEVAVMNNGASTLTVYTANAAEFIGSGAAVSTTLTAAAAPTIFYCFTQGRWFIK